MAPLSTILVNWSPRWLEYGLAEAELIARMSKDPSTQAGAVIFRPDKTIAAKGYNGFPRRIKDDPALYFDRPEKYRRVVHCEMNAILTAREPLDGCVLFTWPFLTCERCAVHVIQAGIAAVVAPLHDGELVDRWGDSFRVALDLYSEAGVEVHLTKPVPAERRKSQSILLERQP